MKTHLKTKFSHLKQSSFRALITRIEINLSSEEELLNFPEPWGDPAKVPQRAELFAAIDAHVSISAEAEDGSRMKIAARNESREKMVAMLQKVAPCLEVVAGHDRAKLGTCGFELRKDTPTSTTDSNLLTGPQEVRSAQGPRSGMILVGCKSVAGARGYEVQISDKSQPGEADFRHAASSSGCRRIKISELTPLRIYCIRIRGIFGKRGPGAWSSLHQHTVL